MKLSSSVSINLFENYVEIPDIGLSHVSGTGVFKKMAHKQLSHD
jgi:hypothetical protein